MRRVFVSVFIVLFSFSLTYAEDYIDLVKKGNDAFNNKDYKKALEYYHYAETEIPESPELEYNMAGALTEDGGYEQAVDKYTKALNTSDLSLEAKTHYNLGNTYYWMKDYQNAIKSYENCLKIAPDDMDAKYNLELARKMLKEQIKPEQQQQQQQQQEQQNQEQEQQQQQQEQNQQEQQQQEEKQDEQQQQQQVQKEEEISKEDAERILNALRDDEKEVQKKIKRQVKAGSYNGNDW